MFSTSLDSQERGSHKIYDPQQSHNHQSIAQSTFKVSYGDATSLTGHVAADTVVIGGVTVAAQALALPTSFSSGVVDDPSDGIVGLGFQRMNSICSSSPSTSNTNNDHKQDADCPTGYGPNPRPTWFENARSALQKGLFSVNFKAGTPGYYSFGTIDEKAYNGDLHYIPINNAKGFWQFPSTTYRIGSAGPLQHFDGADGIADSGTSLLMLAPDVVEAYYADVKNAKNEDSGYTFPCGTVLPDLEIAMGDFMAKVPGNVMEYAETKTKGVCYGGLQSNGRQGPQIFGDILFKALYVVFDYDGLRLGLAPHA